jgi:hypothetical protein
LQEGVCRVLVLLLHLLLLLLRMLPLTQMPHPVFVTLYSWRVPTARYGRVLPGRRHGGVLLLLRCLAIR